MEMMHGDLFYHSHRDFLLCWFSILMLAGRHLCVCVFKSSLSRKRVTSSDCIPVDISSRLYTSTCSLHHQTRSIELGSLSR